MPKDKNVLHSSMTIAETAISNKNIDMSGVYNGWSIDDALRHYLRTLSLPDDTRILKTHLEDFCDLYRQQNMDLDINQDDLQSLCQLLISQELAKSHVAIKKDIPMTKSEFIAALQNVMPGAPALLASILFENLSGKIYMGNHEIGRNGKQSNLVFHSLNQPVFSVGANDHHRKIEFSKNSRQYGCSTNWFLKLMRHDDIKLYKDIKKIGAITYIYPTNTDKDESSPRLSNSSTKTITPRSSEVINTLSIVPSPSISVALAMAPDTNCSTPPSSLPSGYYPPSALSIAIATAVLTPVSAKRTLSGTFPTDLTPSPDLITSISNIQSTPIYSKQPATNSKCKYTGSRERVRSLTTSPDDFVSPCIVKQAVLDQRCNSLIKLKYECLGGKVEAESILLTPRSSKKMLLSKWLKVWMVADGASIRMFRDWRWFVKNKEVVKRLDIPARLVSFKNEPKSEVINLDGAIAVHDPSFTYECYHTFKIHLLQSGQTLSCRLKPYEQARQWVQTINMASAYRSINISPPIDLIMAYGLGSWTVEPVVRMKSLYFSQNSVAVAGDRKKNVGEANPANPANRQFIITSTANQLKSKKETALQTEQSLRTSIELLSRVRTHTITSTTKLSVFLMTQVEYFRMLHLFNQYISSQIEIFLNESHLLATTPSRLQPKLSEKGAGFSPTFELPKTVVPGASYVAPTYSSKPGGNVAGLSKLGGSTSIHLHKTDIRPMNRLSDVKEMSGIDLIGAKDILGSTDIHETYTQAAEF
ncbi:hypothetical protein QVD99_004938 [Batrachochytrium dendrobatidis]|nr:hypothetical protein QVD99_004938 [Batrachochytrium dendrobatidis]